MNIRMYIIVAVLVLYCVVLYTSLISRIRKGKRLPKIHSDSIIYPYLLWIGAFVFLLGLIILQLTHFNVIGFFTYSERSKFMGYCSALVIIGIVLIITAYPIAEVYEYFRKYKHSRDSKNSKTLFLYIFWLLTIVVISVLLKYMF